MPSQAAVQLFCCLILSGTAVAGMPEIKVYVENRGELTKGTIVNAEAVVDAVLAKAGVAAEWHNQGAPDAGQVRRERAIVVRVLARTAEGYHPGALAEAFLNEGVEIHVFGDRLMSKPRQLLQVILGYVLTHEIAHLLEGVARHSEGGIMKSHWGPKDHDEMRFGRLAFEPEDLALIRSGLALRQAGGSLMASAAGSNAGVGR
jgi:hypothetical protein